jgi:tRNA U38,U39,U40 pseudouridine synthase TruA
MGTTERKIEQIQDELLRGAEALQVSGCAREPASVHDSRSIEITWFRFWLENTTYGRRFMQEVKNNPKDYQLELQVARRSFKTYKGNKNP